MVVCAGRLRGRRHCVRSVAATRPQPCASSIAFQQLSAFRCNRSGRLRRPCGLMDKALVFGTKDCWFESCQAHFCVAHGGAACARASNCLRCARACRAHVVCGGTSFGQALAQSRGPTPPCSAAARGRFAQKHENLACQAELCIGFAQQRAQLGMPHAVRAWGPWLRLGGLVVGVGFHFVVWCLACAAPAAQLGANSFVAASRVPNRRSRRRSVADCARESARCLRECGHAGGSPVCGFWVACDSSRGSSRNGGAGRRLSVS